ncbi:hypothetical protein SAMN05660909_02480 [Chitinophaga terrae (ex Kim and Jung 2007)]|uniref:Uncharacterized protein n=1 Tax=Chitinophaga terrae (ex Kim and Jung 2007) TaxID=408074 RepID=A0A1H4C5X9_9BACT|nr:hypothetical protein SAMN05660909_02480 [Chitinophaga terrae (ex Kim and Jung 2007)]
MVKLPFANLIIGSNKPYKTYDIHTPTLTLNNSSKLPAPMKTVSASKAVNPLPITPKILSNLLWIKRTAKPAR